LRLNRDKKGQFIIIAALLIAIMIISASAVMFSAVTYFKHERWEEYLIVIDGIKAGTANLLTVSLANYTQTGNTSVLKTNLNEWRQDVKSAYSGLGVILNYSLASGSYAVYAMTPNYNLGLNSSWYKSLSWSAANATLSVNMTSAGLTGYTFASAVFLRMNITEVVWYSKQNKQYLLIVLTVDKEGPAPITNLQAGNFVQVNVSDAPRNFASRRYYSITYGCFVYEIRVNSVTSKPLSVDVTLVDNRSIKTVSTSTTIREEPN